MEKITLFFWILACIAWLPFVCKLVYGFIKNIISKFKKRKEVN